MKQNKIIYTLLFIFSLSIAFAQESQSMSDNQEHFKNGLALFESGQLLAARREFETYVETYKRPIQNDQPIKYSNAFYYIGAIATDYNNLMLKKY